MYQVSRVERLQIDGMAVDGYGWLVLCGHLVVPVMALATTIIKIVWSLLILVLMCHNHRCHRHNPVHLNQVD